MRFSFGERKIVPVAAPTDEEAPAFETMSAGVLTIGCEALGLPCDAQSFLLEREQPVRVDPRLLHRREDARREREALELLDVQRHGGLLDRGGARR